MVMTTIPEEQLQAIAAKAKAALPLEVNGRVDKAMRLVRSASVELHDDGSATVISESDGLTEYLVQHGECTCLDFGFQAPDGWCAHRIAAAMIVRCQKQATLPPAETSHADMAGVSSQDPHATTGTLGGKTEGGEPPEELPAELSDTLRRGLVFIKQKPFIRYSALLAEAHARGLQKLETVWTYNDVDLSLAQATATFANGSVWTESGDVDRSNVHPKMAMHFRRIASTRAAARALRNALNVGALCTVEELEH